MTDEFIDVEGLAKRFREARAAYDEANKARDNYALDLRIAERDGDEAAIAAVKAENSASLSGWYQLHTAQKQAAVDLCDALGITPSDMRSALYV